jgi:hypothetical protein
MATENLKSSPITGLDAQPIVVSTAGEGAAGVMYVLSDFTSISATGVQNTASTYRMARIPTSAKIKQVLFTCSEFGTAAPSFDINLAFSDSTTDGTNAALQGLIPTTAGNATTTVASYTNPNKLFGTVAGSTSGAVLNKDVTFNGTFTAANQNDDLWDVFGFQNSQGVAIDPGGYFDFLLYVSTAGASGTIAASPANVSGSVQITVYFCMD